jgi:hypothetical protein
MPCRQFSAAILAGSWPTTSPEVWDNASQAQHDKGTQLIQHADALRGIADRVIANQSGEAVNGFHEMLYRKAGKVTDQGDSYFAMSRGSEEVGRLLNGQREDLDKIDRDAHEQIEQIKAAAHGFASQMGVGQAVMAVVMAANAQAKGVDAKTAAQITAQTAKMGLLPPGDGSGGEGPGLDLDPSQFGGFGGGGGRPGPGGMPEAPVFGQKPDAPPHMRGDEGGAAEEDPGQGPGDPNQTTNPQGNPTSAGNGPDQGRHHPHFRDDQGLGGNNGMPMPMPFSGGGSGGGGGSSPLSSAGGGLSGLKPPELGGMGGMGGMPQGLSSGGGLPGGTGMTPPPAASSPFTQGLNAGLAGAPAAPLAPPVSSAPPTASAAPAGAVSSGPASVAAAAGSPVSSPAASPFAAPMAGGPASGGAGSVGPLPPFGSDVRSAATGGGAAVTPASGPAPATVSADRAGSSGGGGLAVPPGVVGSTTGAGAGAATEGVRASQPDPLLEAATQLVYRLLDDTRLSPFSDWCVGVFRTAAGVETIVVNSDGAGFIPQDVFMPRSTRMLFADPGLPDEFRARWFSWANPAETMVAFAEWAGEHVELYALAVSTDLGGSSVPARNAGVPHVEDCSRASLRTDPDSSPRPLDEAYMHRLETVDRALYARLTGVGDGRRPDQSEAWRTTTAAAHVALARAGAIPDLAVPPVIREVLDLVGRGLKVSAECWDGLSAAYMVAVTTAAGLRPGRMGVDEIASPHALAHHDLARLMEILLLWKFDSRGSRDIQYADIAYLAKQINETPRNGAAV